VNGSSRKTIGFALSVALSTMAATAWADPMPARETARVLPKKGFAVGLTSPSALGIGHGLELTTMVVPWFLLSPNVSLRAELIKSSSGIVLTSEYGLGVPTGAMRMLQGFLFPTNATSGRAPGFVLQQYAGLWLSGGDRGVWTARADVTTGLGFGDNPQQPLDTYAPLELWYAPATTGSRWHLGGTYDYRLLDWLRGRAGLHGYAVGKATTTDRSLLYLSIDAALEVRLGKRFRLAVGGQWFNYDTHRVENQTDDNGRTQKVRVRTNDIYPTIDLVFYAP
jgi:hypothetical protein